MSIGGDSEENDDLDGDDELPVIEPRHLPCAGFISDLGFPQASSCPFGIINSEVGKTFAWKVELGAGEVRLRAVSEDGRPECTGKSFLAGEPCPPCAALEFYPKLQGVITRSGLDATTEAKTVNHQYLSKAQLVSRLTEWKRAARMSAVQVFKLQKKGAILVKKLADDKRIIAQGNAPGIRRVLAQALKKGCSSQSILGKLENALSGSYHARG